MKISIAKMRVIHDDWGKITSHFADDGLYIEVIRSAPILTIKRNNEIWKINCNSYEIFRKFIYEVKINKKVFSASPISITRFPTYPKVSALYGTKIDLRESVTHAALNMGVYDYHVKIIDGTEEWVFVTDDDMVGVLKDELYDQVHCDSVELLAVVSGSTAFGYSPLTYHENEVIERAFTNGYFSNPRNINASEMAKKMGVSKVALLQSMHGAINKIIARELLLKRHGL